jgi:hypothetical protein
MLTSSSAASAASVSSPRLRDVLARLMLWGRLRMLAATGGLGTSFVSKE